MEQYSLERFLKIYQPKKGYRFAIDAFILANFVHLKSKESVVELGMGCGIISLILACKYPKIKKIFGVEIQPSLASLAKKNVALNQKENLIEVIQADVKNLIKTFPSNSFDAIIANPPYYSLKGGRLSPNEEKSIARHEIKGSIKDIVRVGQYMLKEKGKLCVIYPAFRCEHLLIVLRQSGLEPKRLRFVHPYVNKDANFILVEAIKGGKQEVRVEFPLIIYEKQRKYTPQVASYYQIKEE
jgi:tRNA1Val (adenine37-N6)-methyltransferase